MEDRFLVRGISKTSGKRITGTLGHPEGTVSDMYNRPCIFYVKDRKRWYDEIIPETLSQCTGLVASSSYRGENREDRLVYEGDIVDIPTFWEQGKRYYYGVILWNQEKVRFEINPILANENINGSKLGRSYRLDVEICKNMSISGTIHTHKELLEG